MPPVLQSRNAILAGKMTCVAASDSIATAAKRRLLRSLMVFGWIGGRK